MIYFLAYLVLLALTLAFNYGASVVSNPKSIDTCFQLRYNQRIATKELYD